MSSYIELSNLVKRERKTEEWIRSHDTPEIMMLIHQLEDQVKTLQIQVEMLKENRDE